MTLVNTEPVVEFEGKNKLTRLVLFEGEIAKKLQEANENGFSCSYDEDKQTFAIYKEEPRTK